MTEPAPAPAPTAPSPRPRDAANDGAITAPSPLRKMTGADRIFPARKNSPDVQEEFSLVGI